MSQDQRPAARRQSRRVSWDCGIKNGDNPAVAFTSPNGIAATKVDHLVSRSSRGSLPSSESIHDGSQWSQVATHYNKDEPPMPKTTRLSAQYQREAQELIQGRLMVMVVFAFVIFLVAAAFVQYFAIGLVFTVVALTSLADLDFDLFFEARPNLRFFYFLFVLAGACWLTAGQGIVEAWPCILCGLTGLAIVIYQLKTGESSPETVRFRGVTVLTCILFVVGLGGMAAYNLAVFFGRTDGRFGRYSFKANFAFFMIQGSACITAFILTVNNAIHSRSSTVSLFYTLDLFIVQYGVAHIYMGIVTMDNCYDYLLCVEDGNQEERVYALVTGSCYILVVTIAHLRKRGLYGFLAEIIRAKTRAHVATNLNVYFNPHKVEQDQGEDLETFTIAQDMKPEFGMTKYGKPDFYVVGKHPGEVDEKGIKALSAVRDRFFAQLKREPIFCWPRTSPDEAESERYLGRIPNELAGCKRMVVVLDPFLFRNPRNMLELFAGQTIHSDPRINELTISELYASIFSADLDKDMYEFNAGNLMHSATARQVIRKYGHDQFNDDIRYFFNVIETARDKVRARDKRKGFNFERMVDVLSQRGLISGSEFNITKPEELERSRLKLLHQLGSGQFGAVRKALYSPTNNTAEYEVAVKMTHTGAKRSEEEDLLSEAIMIAQFQHNNVLKVVGVVTVGDPIMLVLQFCSRGSLQGLLLDVDEECVDILDLIYFCKGIASGCEYLASRKFVHRDLASRNVLVDSAGSVKIADFGMSREMGKGYYFREDRAADAQLPLRWCSPEVLLDARYSESSDVWSYGATCVEIFGLGIQPYANLSNAAVIERLRDGLAPPIPHLCPQEFASMVVSPCFTIESDDRPPFSVAVAKITEWIRAQGIEISDGLEIDADGVVSIRGTRNRSTSVSSTLRSGKRRGESRMTGTASFPGHNRPPMSPSIRSWQESPTQNIANSSLHDTDTGPEKSYCDGDYVKQVESTLPTNTGLYAVLPEQNGSPVLEPVRLSPVGQIDMMNPLIEVYSPGSDASGVSPLPDLHDPPVDKPFYPLSDGKLVGDQRESIESLNGSDISSPTGDNRVSIRSLPVLDREVSASKVVATSVPAQGSMSTVSAKSSRRASSLSDAGSLQVETEI